MANSQKLGPDSQAARTIMIKIVAGDMGTLSEARSSAILSVCGGVHEVEYSTSTGSAEDIASTGNSHHIPDTYPR
jgi:hypothetical protein